MSKQNFKSQAKRKRELAKLDKRTAKDQKRAAKKAENSVDVVAVATPRWFCSARGGAEASSISGPAPRGRRAAEGAADARRDGAALEEHQDRQAEDSLVATSVLPPLRCLRR